MKKRTLLFTLPIAACCLAFTSCSDTDTAANADANGNNGQTTLILRTNETAPVSRAIATSKYDVIERSGWGNPKYTYVSEGNLNFLKYAFKVGDKLYTYDKSTGLQSTFTCTEVLNDAAAKFTSANAHITSGQPLYLFTAQAEPIKQSANTFKFAFAEQEDKGFIFGQNVGNVDSEGKNSQPGVASADITKSQFIGIGKVAVPQDFHSEGGNAYSINGTLDASPVMIAYYGDMYRDFDRIRIVKSFNMSETQGTRGHYKSATYNIDNGQWTPGDFSTDKDELVFNVDNTTQLGQKWLNGNSLYVPIVPGHYKEARLTVDAQGKNADGYYTKMLFKAVKNNFQAELNKFYNVGSITGYQKSKGVWPDMDASDLWIHGAATPYGWAKKHTLVPGETQQQEESRTWTTSQKMKRQSNGEFVYIGHSLTKDVDWQTNPYYDNQRKGDGSYKFYFVNNGLYEAAGLVPADGTVYNPGFGDHGQDASLSYYSSRVNAVRTVSKWWMSDKDKVYENDGNIAESGWYKFIVNLQSGSLKVEKYTGAIPGNEYFTLKKSATDNTKVAENVYRLWMLGTATNLTDNGQGAYASSQAIALNYNLALGQYETAADVKKFYYKGYFKQGYIQLLWKYGYNESATENNLTPDFNGSETGVNVPSGSGNIFLYPVAVTPGTAQNFHVEAANGKNGQWYIGTPGYYKLEVDLSNNTVKFTPITEAETH